MKRKALDLVNGPPAEATHLQEVANYGKAGTTNAVGGS